MPLIHSIHLNKMIVSMDDSKSLREKWLFNQTNIHLEMVV